MAGRRNRSSKTDHVLNLLSGAGGAGASNPTPTPQPADPAPPADERAGIRREPAPASAAAPPEGGRRMAAPILEVARASSEALERTIHGALEQALETELAEEPPAPPEQENASEASSAGQEALPPEQCSEPAPEPAAPEIPPGAPGEQAPAPEPGPQPEADDPGPARENPCVLPDGTVCVNVMWELVEEKAERYIRMFGLCGCPRCVADVKALALTRLPAKYVVMKESARRPMISLYRARFDAPVTAQLLSACKQVMDAPRHGDTPKE